jgi:hypothetical protein
MDDQEEDVEEGDGGLGMTEENAELDRLPQDLEESGHKDSTHSVQGSGKLAEAHGDLEMEENAEVDRIPEDVEKSKGHNYGTYSGQDLGKPAALGGDLKQQSMSLINYGKRKSPVLNLRLTC